MGMIGGIFSFSFTIIFTFFRLNYLILKCLVILLTWLRKAYRSCFAAKPITHGSARFASLSEIKQNGLSQGNGLLLGQIQGHTIHAPEDDHLLVVAPTKSGKTSCLVNTNLLKLGKASAIVTDPNGESWAITQRERSQHGPIHLWAPFSPLSESYNPLDFVQTGTPHERDDVELIANLIVPDGRNEEDGFWNNQARDVLMGLILYVLHTKTPEKQTLAEVRHLITLSEDAFDELLEGMIFCGHPIIRRCAHNLKNQDSKLRSNVMATVQSKTRIWDSPNLCKVTSRSDFRFSDLRHDTATVYLVVPPEQLATYYPAVALLTGIALAEINRSKPKEAKRVVLMLDEFANLGRLKPVENAISIARKAGIQLCLFVQDVAQIEKVYGTAWRSFAANCRTKVFFGVNEVMEAKNLSDTLGVHTVKTKSAGHNHGITDVVPGQLNAGTGEAARALKTPDEVMTLNNQQCIILQQGLRPILAEKLYYKDKHFQGLYDNWDGLPPYANLEPLIQSSSKQMTQTTTQNIPFLKAG